MQNATACFDRHFSPLAAAYQLERVSFETYWATFERELSAHFPPEVFFRFNRQPPASLPPWPPSPIRDFTLLRLGGEVVAQFCGEFSKPGNYRMWNTVVRTDMRRRGIYQQIVGCTLAYTKELGFDTVSSEHAPCNNAILLAKLGAGFYVTAFDISGAFGPSLHLTYFHNPLHEDAFKFRCGMATLTPELRDTGHGAFAQLAGQFGAPDVAS